MRAALVMSLVASSALAQPIDLNNGKFRNITVTGTESANRINATFIDAGTVKADVVDAGVAYGNAFISRAASGSNGFACATNGARFDFGAGANDYASSDGTTVTFAGPVTVTSTLSSAAATNLVLAPAAGVVQTSGYFQSTNTSTAFYASGSGGAYLLANRFAVNTAPTISSGFGTSPSVTTNNGTAAFTINVGTGGTANSGVIGLPAAANGWVCHCQDITTNTATVFITKQTASTTTSCTVGNYDAAGAAAAWAASDILHCIAMGR